jgi:translation initiation factor IF-1
MFEVYVLVARKKSIGIQVLACLFLALGVAVLLLSCISPVFLVFAVAAFALWYLFQFRWNREFEYSYFDGEVRFARISNKSRRKRLKVFSMDEVVTIAPSEDRSVYRYENDNGMTIVDYTSGRKDEPYYVMVHQTGEATEVIRFEPDEKYLDAVCVKYGQKVIRRAGQAQETL